jgi:hypothetical protein
VPSFERNGSVIHIGGDPGLRPIAIVNAAEAVADPHLIDIIYDGQQLTLKEYAELLLREDNPLPCYRPGSERGLAEVAKLELLRRSRVVAVPFLGSPVQMTI